MKKAIYRITVLAALVALAIASTAFLGRADGGNAGPAPARHDSAGRGTIHATGRLEPEEVIDVGAQTCGRVITFGRGADGKTIDSGSPVEEGTILARIDDGPAASEVAKAEAGLEQARSAVQRAQADLEQYKAKLPEAEARWVGTQQLQRSGAANAMELVTYKSSYDAAKAGVAVGEAAIVQAQDAVALAEATLQQARQKLGDCVIRSPAKGVVLERRVSIGQTMICNMQAPSLFLIARDLRRMKVQTPVSEADIGSIHWGQPLQFAVETFPNKTFHGTVSKVRLNAKTTERGAAYMVEATVDNSDGYLLPYLTTDVQFLVDRQ